MPKPTWLQTLLGAVLVFNLIDAALTVCVVGTGRAVETNPLMAAALHHGAVPFALAKLGVVSLGVLVLWRERARRLAVVGSVVAFAAYACVTLWHVQTVQVLAGAEPALRVAVVSRGTDSAAR